MIQNLIIGAGPAGLATAARLRNNNRDFVLVEQSQHIGNAWRNHYDRLHLHTVKEWSHLPFRPFPEAYPRYVSRQQLVDYMDEYAEHFDIRPEFGVEIEKIKRVSENPMVFEAVASNGKVYQVHNVILATGKNRIPYLPKWQDQDQFKGKILHSRQYKNPAPFAGQKVLVVGIGNTGAEIALDLAEHQIETWIAVRSPLAVVPRDLNGRPVQVTAKQLEKLPFGLGDWLGTQIRKVYYGNLSKYGLKTPPTSPAKLLKETGQTPLIDIGTIAAIKAGQIKVVGALKGFSGTEVQFEDGNSLPFDAVILATGYRSKLDQLIENGADVVDEYDGRRSPIGKGPYKGLYFVGFDNYKTGGILGTIMRDSELVVEDITLKKEF